MDKYDKALKDLETALFEEYKKIPPYFSDHKNRYKSDLQIIDNYYTAGEILEVGSLPCHLTYCLKSLGYQIIGLDLNPERVASFIRNNNLYVVKCDIENERLPFNDNQFDLILLNEVFEHLRIDPIFALKEINRVLKYEGVLKLTTPNLYSLGNIASFCYGKGLTMTTPYKEFKKLHTVGHMGHFREYSTSEVKEFLDNTGFQLIDVKYKTYNRSRRGRFIDLFYHIIPALRPYQVVISKKQS